MYHYPLQKFLIFSPAVYMNPYGIHVQSTVAGTAPTVLWTCMDHTDLSTDLYDVPDAIHPIYFLSDPEDPQA